MNSRIIVASSLLVILATYCATPAAGLPDSRGRVAPAQQAGANGRVCAACNGAMLRETPSLKGNVVRILRAGSRLTILARSNDAQWLRVNTADNFSGWLGVGEVTPDRLPTVPVTLIATASARPTLKPTSRPSPSPVSSPTLQPTAQATATPVAPPATATVLLPTSEATATTSAPAALPSATAGPSTTPPPIAAPHPGLLVPASMRAVFQRGKKLGNRAPVFSKVGDSLTVATYVLYPFGWGRYDLGDYAGLQASVNYFASTVARGADSSFSNTPLSADNGWTSADVLDPARANPGICQPGESPLRCEYRTVRPAIALILLGTNDVSKLDAARYRANMTQIVTQSLELGVIPVLSTVPPRMQFEGECNAYNAILGEIAAQYNVPLSDYGAAMRALPNFGLSSDGVHPSWPDGDPAIAASFTPTHLQSGYTLRNLMLIQALDGVRLSVMTP